MANIQKFIADNARESLGDLPAAHVRNLIWIAYKIGRDDSKKVIKDLIDKHEFER